MIRSTNLVKTLLVRSQNFFREKETFPESISEGCFFNVVRFGKCSNPVFPNGSVAYSRRTVDLATGIIGCSFNEIVGKDLCGALKHILKQRPKNGLPRQILLFPRNEIFESETILELIRQQAHDTQVFCYVMADVVPRSFIGAMARAGGGKVFFGPDQSWNSIKLLEKESCLLQLEQLKVSWKDSTGNTLSGLEQFPDIEILETFSSLVSSSYRGNRLSVFGKFPASNVPVSCTIASENTTDIVSSKSDVIEFHEDETLKFSTNSLHRFVGRKLIRELEKREICGQDMKERIINLALKDQLISKFTSCVGKRKENNNQAIFRNLTWKF